GHSVTLRLVGRRCRGASHCLNLRGTLTGTLTEGSANPDAPKPFTIDSSGNVKPLEQASATGNGRGTGYIYRGHERLTLTLTAANGSVTIEAHSARVPGFTNP